MVSRVDAYLLGHPTAHRCIQNIGGIGNVTYLPAFQPHDAPAPLETKTWEAGILGWDTGPGNLLLDLAVQHFSNGQQTYDQHGAWASRGTPCQPLVAQWLQQPFFPQPPPKSTGREAFGLAYFKDCLTAAQVYALTPADILATLTELTAASIADSYQAFLPQAPDQVLICGGGQSKSLSPTETGTAPRPDSGSGH
ncbi:anhydro-N-acetylmuramic acid kinase [Neosynechococcus sphagnicola]|uniref:anhydro-N-acetylmuramic acid kinase n=1 Tax=Neosynechococcus sphagnicola TaxID=1501145 RepID=UPI000AC53974